MVLLREIRSRNAAELVEGDIREFYGRPLEVPPRDDMPRRNGAVRVGQNSMETLGHICVEINNHVVAWMHPDARKSLTCKGESPERRGYELSCRVATITGRFGKFSLSSRTTRSR